MLYTVTFLPVPNMLPPPCHGSARPWGTSEPSEPRAEQQPLKTAHSVTRDPQPLSPVLSSMR